jgi:hypothetical protein
VILFLWVLWTNAHPGKRISSADPMPRAQGEAATVVFDHSICQHQYVLLLEIPDLRAEFSFC